MSHDREISGPLIASYLLNLLDHYSLKAIVKITNIVLLQIKFLLILDGKSFNQSNNIIHVDGIKIRPCSMFKHYAHYGSAFYSINIYKYLQFVSNVKQSQHQGGDYEFENGHRQREDFIQILLKYIKQLALLVLHGKLSKNEELKDTILKGPAEIDARQINLNLILLSLFVPWNHLSSLFLAEE